MVLERKAGAALSTPIKADLSVDTAGLISHASLLLAGGLDFVTLFGTTGEGASFTPIERNEVIEACSVAGISADQLGCGLFSLSASEAGKESRSLFSNGCGHVLLAPPVFYKNIDNEGLYRWFSEVIEAAGPKIGSFVLYQIPALTQIELSVELVKRLASAFPEVISGVKDSSGNWDYTERLIRDRGPLEIYIGHEGYLEDGMRAGAVGAIAGTANFLPEVIHAIVHEKANYPNLPFFIEELLSYPIIPAVKALISYRTGTSSWLEVRPPLSKLTKLQNDALCSRLDSLFPVSRE